MRKSFLLYLFVFTALLAVYFYVTGQRMLDSKDEKIEQLETELATKTKAEDSLEIPEDLYKLTGNEEAMTYLENRGFVPREVVAEIENHLISQNKAAEDNDFVPYEGMEGFFRINNVRVINHKWVMAGFTDGTYWGDLFLTYELDDAGRLSLETKEALIYPQN